MNKTDLKALKIEAAKAVLAEVRDGMVLGLGTGSTAEEFVKLLGAALSRGELRDIAGVCTSVLTEKLAASLGIKLLQLEDNPDIALAVDGADEIDPRLRLIKGLGGALLREKIVEQASRRFIVIADHTKEVERLGRGVLPVEVVRFAAPVLEARFTKLGFQPTLRVKEGRPFVTDEGHVLLDIKAPADRDMGEVVEEIRRHAGVVDTGFFPTEATEAVIAAPEGIRWRVRE